MKKQNLNEQVSRIKGMMKFNENFESPMGGQERQITSVEEVINYITEFSSRMEELAEEFREKLDGTDYWPYVNKMYSGIRSVSDMEGQYTRNDDQRGENVSNVIELIRSDEQMDGRSSVEDDDYDEKQERNYGVDDEEDEDREPSDDDIFNGFGREGGISY